MNIKLRLALQFTLIVLVILVFFSGLVFYFSYLSQLTKFRQNLLEKAQNTATLLINVDDVDSTLLTKIHESTISWEREELVLTDSAFSIIYKYNPEFLDDRGVLIYNRSDELNYFTFKGKDGVFYRHLHNNRTYYVYIMASDVSRDQNLLELLKFLFWSIIISICLSVLFSYFFARRAIRPISEIIRDVKEINSLKLHSRLNEGNKKDEIAQLAVTFNQLLSDLEIAFSNQEDFVSNASHELRTPLTIMIGETEYFLSRKNTVEEYEKQLSELLSDLRKLNLLINNMLELAQINRDRNVVLTEIRIDEVVFNAIYKVKSKYIDRKIIPKITYPESGNELIINGNEGLLEIAFKNLIDNACKFSDKDVSIEFIIKDETVTIAIADEGIGIPEGEIGSVNKPFMRASNARFIGGYGIGLSLVSGIVDIHKGDLRILSKINEGTRFEITFRRK